MPTNMFQSRTIFDDANNVNVLFSMEGLRSPRMATFDAASLQATGGQKILEPGTVLIRGNGAAAGFGRAFPGSYASAASATTVATITVREPAVFRVGDVLVKGAPGATSPLGTIQSIDTVTNVITLTANTATAVVIGDSIWVATIPATDILGLVVTSYDILRDPNDVAAYTGASVYSARLLFWNSAIQSALPGIHLV